MARPIGIDLFSGAGGFSLGFEQAGFDVIAAVERDPVHAAVHKFNFPKCTTIPSSVIGLTAADIRKRARLGNRKVHVVFGGAPCQGFSLIGQRLIDDPRNLLVREFVRLVAELDASYFVFENVKGLTIGRHRQFLDELIDLFSEVGYNIRLPWQVLNACAYGVPQDRQRLFLLGAKKGLKLPQYPPAVSDLPGELSTGLDKCPTCLDALGDLPEAEEYSTLLNSDYVEDCKWGAPTAYAKALRCAENDNWHFGYKRLWDPHTLTSSLRTNHTSISRSRFAKTKPGTVEPISRFFRLPENGVANTLRAGTDASRGAFTSPRPIHFQKSRCITVREMARLHGFPDWFRFHQTKWHGARQVGNAVPPPLARAVSSEVLKALGLKPTKPSTSLQLESPELLAMDMTHASRHWGIANPVAKRDRKSGATKRKQEEIEMANAMES